MKLIFTTFLVLVIVILSITVGVVSGASPAQAAPLPPAHIQPLSTCGPVTLPAARGGGIRVIITNTDMPEKLLDTTFPVNVDFANRFLLFPTGYSTDNYSVYVYAFGAGDPNNPRMWLIASTALHC
jgi:hypothetical protein